MFSAHAVAHTLRVRALQMLKETLDKMSEKIEITNQGWEAGTGDSIARRLEEHKMGVSADPH
jgi:hypothetical protein